MKKRKTRLIARIGIEFFVLKVEDIAFIYRDGQVIIVVDKAERKYLIDKSLSELEEELDTRTFFRANRQYLVNIHHIKSYKRLDKVKLSISLSACNDCKIIVSQELAPHFKKWMQEEN